jgi:hypothetical protein
MRDGVCDVCNIRENENKYKKRGPSVLFFYAQAGVLGGGTPHVAGVLGGGTPPT